MAVQLRKMLKLLGYKKVTSELYEKRFWNNFPFVEYYIEIILNQTGTAIIENRIKPFETIAKQNHINFIQEVFDEMQADLEVLKKCQD